MPLTIILGPTASGKTALGIALAKKTGGAVVSADSRQVYAGLNIGTAKPKDAWQTVPHDILVPDVVSEVDPVRDPPFRSKRNGYGRPGRPGSNGVPHYLLNIVSPATTYSLPPPLAGSRPKAGQPTPYSLAQWQQHAYQVIDQVIEKGQRPILVGGTMLYIDSLRYNYQIPAVPPNEALRQQLQEQSTATLYQQLITADPATAAFIEPHHQQRIIRALEVIAATGQPFSVSRQRSTPRYQCKVIGIFPGWEILKKNILERSQAMFTAGLVEEVQHLRQRYSPALPLLQTLMYKQAGAVLDNRLTLPEAITEANAATLRYARRQMAWWKNQTDIEWFAAPDPAIISPSLNIR